MALPQRRGGGEFNSGVLLAGLWALLWILQPSRRDSARGPVQAHGCSYLPAFPPLVPSARLVWAPVHPLPSPNSCGNQTPWGVPMSQKSLRAPGPPWAPHLTEYARPLCTPGELRVGTLSFLPPSLCLSVSVSLGIYTHTLTHLPPHTHVLVL